MNTLVWILLVTGRHQAMVQTIGPFTDRESCYRVQHSETLVNYKADCIHVSLSK